MSLGVWKRLKSSYRDRAWRIYCEINQDTLKAGGLLEWIITRRMSPKILTLSSAIRINKARVE